MGILEIKNKAAQKLGHTDWAAVYGSFVGGAITPDELQEVINEAMIMYGEQCADSDKMYEFIALRTIEDLIPEEEKSIKLVDKDKEPSLLWKIYSEIENALYK